MRKGKDIKVEALFDKTIGKEWTFLSGATYVVGKNGEYRRAFPKVKKR